MGTPVRAKMVHKPDEWQWSNYKTTAGLKTVTNGLTIDWTLGQFGRNKQEAQRRYRKFISGGIQKGSPWDNLQGQILLGKEKFIDHFKDHLTDKEKIKEIPRVQRYAHRPSLFKLFTVGEKPVRGNRHIYTAHIQYGYTLKEIADHLNLHYTTVSKVMKGFERK